MAFSPTGKRISRRTDLDLDENALEPGQVLDLGTDAAASGLPAARSERADPPPGIPIAKAQIGRRISPLVTGRRAMPSRGLSVVSSADRIPAALPPARNPAPVLAPAPRPITPAPRAATPPPPKNAKSRNTVGSLLVQLGRYGDIINVLPLLAEEARLKGHPIQMMVSEEFADILEGVSYVEPVIFPGHYSELPRAWKIALSLDPDARCSQVHTPGMDFPRKEDSFARDSWRRIGAGGRWEQIPLVFDRRDREREDELASTTDWTKPVVLVNLSAQSFPFPHAEKISTALILDAKAKGYTLIDISNLKAHRIYDLLGLFDRATLLITADTATQHLAQASSVPVIAFRVSEPWFGSPKRANHILNRRYSDIDTREVLQAVARAVKTPPPALVVHVFPSDGNEESMSLRENIAQGSWQAELLNSIPCKVEDFPRNSTNKLQDSQATMYMIDIIETGMNATKSPDDIVIFTNSDVGFSDDALKNIRRLCALKGACFGYRFDHESIEVPLDHFDTVHAPSNGGLDIFAFTRRWLNANAWRLPDMLLGRTGWDLVYRNIVRQTGGAEVYGAIWHENHESWWKKNFDTPGNAYNTALLKKYRDSNDPTRPYDR